MKDLAKYMADVIGHGMSEKCERHAEIAEEYFKDEWISVEDRLPEEHEDVLTYFRFDLIFGGHSFSMCQDCMVSPDRWDNENDVTHWMPLPEPPKEKEQ